MINSTDMALRYGLMEADIKGTMIWARRVEKGNMYGKIIVIMMEIGLITKLRAEENMFGPTVVNMKESGWIIKCMGKGNTNGKTVENMKVSINMIKSTE